MAEKICPTCMGRGKLIIPDKKSLECWANKHDSCSLLVEDCECYCHL